jgi:hypothetical protein
MRARRHHPYNLHDVIDVPPPYRHNPYNSAVIGHPALIHLPPATPYGIPVRSPHVDHRKFAIGQVPFCMDRERMIAFLDVWYEVATLNSNYQGTRHTAFYALRGDKRSDSGMWHVDVDPLISELLLRTAGNWYFTMDGEYIINAAYLLPGHVVKQPMTVTLSTHN